ncbi:hypothetical protein NitYY0826_C1078 [Nitratiruptor sp. YY08-26]|nr:hypothetical protein NitYY0813_C1076 [Nitratiruptor sp. YY08-13]BCD66138.1 hypothetical protein NitYY0826_C1078 [Nitratiruptor sp. YY08-26]
MTISTETAFSLTVAFPFLALTFAYDSIPSTAPSFHRYKQ